ncbi:MAG: hypothetical protein MRJ93_01595 [Nitrososphaeraceae archaeon]|nr:hypothetical protein [Nitrososphaeraceae archaeon]
MITYNSFPMRDWHVKHMEKTIVKYISGLSTNPSLWEKRQYKRFNNIYRTRGNIKNDIKHGVTNEEVQLFLQKLRDDSTFLDLRNKDGVLERLDEVEKYFYKLRYHIDS